MYRIAIAALIACIVGLPVLKADDVKQIDPEHLKPISKLLLEETAKLKELPVKVAHDPEHGVGIEGEKRHLMVVPDAKLTAESIAAVKGNVLPVGTLFLNRVTIVVAGEGLAQDKHRTVEIAAKNEKVTVKVMQMAIAKVEGQLVLLVYAGGTTPALVTPLVEVKESQAAPVALDGRTADNKGIELVLTLHGRYRATIPVGPQD